MKFPFYFSAVLAALLPLVSEAAEPVSHQAVYDISLASTKGGAAGVVNSSGKMSFSVRKECGQWKTESVFSLDVGYEMAGNDTTNWKQTTTESANGCFFEFDVFVREKGKDRKELSGTAVCEKNKKVLRLTDPVRSQAVLPMTVAYPVTQTLRLLEAAERGEKSVSSYVFDGTRPESLYMMNAVISVPEKFRSGTAEGDLKLISGKKAYRFDTAFFKAFGESAGRDGSPHYEVSLYYYENGISDMIEQDFGSYRLKSRLVSVKELKENPCPSKKKTQSLTTR